MISDRLAIELNGARRDAKRGEVLTIAELTHPAAGSQQCFGGHTTAVDAGAAHFAALDDGRLQALLSSVLRCIKAAIAGPDHDQVVVHRRGQAPNAVAADSLLSCPCLTRSSNSTPAATATLRDSTAA